MSKKLILSFLLFFLLLQGCGLETKMTFDYSDIIVEITPLSTNKIALVKYRQHYKSDWIADYDYYKQEWFLVLLDKNGAILDETELRSQSYDYNPKNPFKISNVTSDSQIVIKSSKQESKWFVVLKYDFNLQKISQDTTSHTELPITDKIISSPHINCTKEKLIFSDNTNLYVKYLFTETIDLVPNQRYCAKKQNLTPNLLTYNFTTTSSTVNPQIYNLKFNLFNIDEETLKPLEIDFETVIQIDSKPIESISQFSDSLFLVHDDTINIILKVKDDSLFVTDTISGQNVVLDSDSTVLEVANYNKELIRKDIVTGQETVIYSLD